MKKDLINTHKKVEENNSKNTEKTFSWSEVDYTSHWQVVISI